MIGGWWWRGRGWLDDTKMEWRDHGGRFRRDEMKLYTDRNNERCSNFPRLFRLEIRVKRDTGGFTCPVVSKNRGPYFQMEITESRKTCKWADTSSELIERFHRHSESRERNARALQYTRVAIHTRVKTHTYGDVEGEGGKGEGGRRYIRLVDVIKREDKFGTSTRINSVWKDLHVNCVFF